jgi:CubicO group peptidase (beta-lactamase class C family)
MHALRLVDDWPVATVAAAFVAPDGSVSTTGPTDHRFRLASIAKMLVGWSVLIGRDEGIVSLDDAAGPAGCTLRHLLAHASGLPFEGDVPVAPPGSRRIYSNTGIELAAQHLADAAGMQFDDYLRDGILEPLGMTATTLDGSPAHAVHSTLDDVLRFVRELRSPRLVDPATAAEFSTVQFASLGGIVPGVGRFDDCPWGLGTEIRGTKQPHWTGTRNSPATFGHFGGAGTLLWVDPVIDVACVALTDRPFDEWSSDALRLWPALADAVIAECGA